MLLIHKYDGKENMKAKLDVFITNETGLLAIGFKESSSDYVELSREDVEVLIKKLSDLKDKVASIKEF